MARKLLLVVDVQNDFCARNGKFDTLNEPIDLVKKTIPNIHFAINKAREIGCLIVFTRSLQVYNVLPPNIKARMRIHGRKNKYLVPNSWGADFFQVKPLKNEVTIDKYRYDIFTNPDFKKYLIKNKIDEIIFCGYFTDMCIDSAMRTAYQLGYCVSLLKDATASLFYKQNQIEKFMIKFYNTQIKTSSNFWK